MVAAGKKLRTKASLYDKGIRGKVQTLMAEFDQLLETDEEL